MEVALHSFVKSTLMEMNGLASHHCRFITGATAPGGHPIMGRVGFRAVPACVQRGVNGLSMFVAPSNCSGHCAVFTSFEYSPEETQFSGSLKL